ncbi:MAG: DUF423 domain-containing protein, partial [Planctomycetes bacterium]|nr:DUF423 domain-containing protein [Planctomycetota bacterium]
MCGRRWLILAAALGGLAVVAGAWAGHGLGEYCEHRFADAPPRALAGMTVPAAWY